MKKLLTILLILVISLYGETTTIASDNGGNYGDVWTSGSNGGFGFGVWNIEANGGTGYAGAFIGNPSEIGITGMSSTSFGLYANPSSSGASVNVKRPFSNPLSIGQTFSFQLGINWDSGSDGSKGFSLYTGGINGTEIFNINNGGSPEITYYNHTTSTGGTFFNNYGTTPMTVNIKLLSSNEMQITANGRDGTETFDQTFTISAAPDAFKFYAFQMQGGDNQNNRQPYFNNLTITDPDGQVPITLASFSAAALNGCVSVTWVTESETENAAFRIYRDGEMIAELDGAGTTTEPQSYSYTDQYVIPGRTYSYVLADVDYQGKETKHPKVEVEVKAEGVDRDYTIGAAYPNPFNPTTIVPLNLAKDARVTATLYDITGRPLRELQNGSLSAGSHAITIDGAALSTGIYFVHINVNNVTHVQKIALMK